MLLFNPNQGSFGNRIANIAFAQGSQKAPIVHHNHHGSKEPDWQHRPGVFNTFPYSIYYVKLFVLKLFWVQRHKGDIATSKSRPTLRCFVPFDLENSLRPTACISTSQLPKSSTLRCFVPFDLEIASRHNGVQFFIAPVTSWFPTALASLLFDPPSTS